MFNFLLKIYYYGKLFWYSLFFGIKNAELLINSQNTKEGSSLEIINDGTGGVFKDVLEQKITQEVEELRYSSYIIAKESKKYKYIGDGQVKKKTENQLSEKHGIIDESDNLPIILIQDNFLICEDVLSILKEVDNKDNKQINNIYQLKIKRSNTPRFKIENYIKKLVLKESDGNYVIDLYCSKYPKQFSSRQDKSFLSEIQKIKNRMIKSSDILEFDELSFITSNAWGVDDWFKFSFNKFEYYDIIEFDGNYIIRLGCLCNNFMENLLDKIYSSSADKKYQNKERRENSVIDLTPYIEKKQKEDSNLNLFENVKFSIENDK